MFFLQSLKQEFSSLSILITQNKFSVDFNKPRGCGNILDFIHIDLKKCETMVEDMFHTTVTLNEGQGHRNWQQTVECSGLDHHNKFERNRSVNVRIQAGVCLFLSLSNNEITQCSLR